MDYGNAIKRSMALEEVLARYAKGMVYELDMLVYFVVAARFYPPVRIWRKVPRALKGKFRAFVLETPMEGVKFLKGTFTNYWDSRLLALWKDFFESREGMAGGDAASGASELPVTGTRQSRFA